MVEKSGLRIWDANGNLIIDTTTRMGTLLGVVDTGKANGSVSNSGFALGLPYFTSMSIDPGASQIIGPSIQVIGTTLYWNFRQDQFGGNNNTRIIYGVT